MAANAIARYVRLEKSAGRNGDWQRAARIARHVCRACNFCSYRLNPYG